MSSEKRRFEFLEHTADIYVAAYGRDLEEAFENAALAMFEVMTDTGKVVEKLEETMEVEGFDKKALLYNWLEALLVRFETAENLYSRFRVIRIQHIEEGFKLKARIYGEPFILEKHLSKVGVKAITYHRMEIEEKPQQATVRFILDI